MSSSPPSFFLAPAAFDENGDNSPAPSAATVPPGTASARLDKWLAEAFPAFSRSRLKALIEEGCVALDGATIKDPALRVKPGQTAVVVPPEARPAAPIPQDIPLNVLYEDDQLIVLNKPAGLVVHPGAGSPDRTLVNALLYYCGDRLSGIGGVRRPGIVHRIDKETSGLLAVAKTDRAHLALSEQFAAKTAERAYRALVWGVPKPPAGQVEGNIGRSPGQRQKMAVVKRGGKAALTGYAVRETFLDGTCSLLECRLATGRTHQIRVHMTSIGHALVGDPVYGAGGGHRLAKRAHLPPVAVEALRTFPRQALHAFLLGFDHPITGRRLRFESPLPEDFAVLLALLAHPVSS